MTKDQGDWKAEAVARFERRLDALRERLGPHASIVEVEALLAEHENAIMQDALTALTEGASPPREPESNP